MKSALKEISRVCGAVFQRDGNTKLIWVFGPLPPPINGQSRYNQEIVAFFSRYRQVVSLPLGTTPLGKLLRALWLPIIALVLVRQRDDVYTSPPGQNGLWLFLLLVAVLRLRRLEHYVHHLSFRAINLGPNLPSRLLCAIGGNLQHHILLSSSMRSRYADLYLTATQREKSRVLPNSFLFSAASGDVPLREGPIVLGHLSVMTREKGVDYLLTLFRRLVEAGIDCRLCLAGPISDAGLEMEVRKTVERFPELASWRGAVYGGEKEAFYRGVDLFVLPSKLIDEADPLVIIEAYRRGCDVIASDTGCIAERIRTPDALLRFSEADDTVLLASWIDRLRENRHTEAAACVNHANKLYAESIDYAKTLFAEFEIEV